MSQRRYCTGSGSVEAEALAQALDFFGAGARVVGKRRLGPAGGEVDQKEDRRVMTTSSKSADWRIRRRRKFLTRQRRASAGAP